MYLILKYFYNCLYREFKLQFKRLLLCCLSDKRISSIGASFIVFFIPKDIMILNLTILIFTVYYD